MKPPPSCRERESGCSLSPRDLSVRKGGGHSGSFIVGLNLQGAAELAQTLTHSGKADADAAVSDEIALFFLRYPFAAILNLDEQPTIVVTDGNRRCRTLGVAMYVGEALRMIRKMAISLSCGRRPKLEGMSRSTLILLRSAKPSAYQRSAEASPASSRSGG
jgi:hypothetical protein